MGKLQAGREAGDLLGREEGQGGDDAQAVDQAEAARPLGAGGAGEPGLPGVAGGGGGAVVPLDAGQALGGEAVDGAGLPEPPAYSPADLYSIVRFVVQTPPGQ